MQASDQWSNGRRELDQGRLTNDSVKWLACGQMADLLRKAGVGTRGDGMRRRWRRGDPQSREGIASCASLCSRRGVQPLQAVQCWRGRATPIVELTSALDASSSSATSAWPRSAASSSGVHPPCSHSTRASSAERWLTRHPSQGQAVCSLQISTIG